MIEYFGSSIVAPHKIADQANEDYFEARRYDDGSLLVAVADGATGPGGGAIAAKAAVSMVHEIYGEARSPGRALFERFRDRLGAWSPGEDRPGMPRCTLSVVQFASAPDRAGARASYFGIGDTAILLAEDKRLGAEYPKTFVCYRIFSRPQPFVDSNLYAYVDLLRREVVGRPIFGQFDLLPGDICLVYTDGIRDEYIQRTVKREHKFLWDIRERGPQLAVDSFIDVIHEDLGDDATVVAILATAATEDPRPTTHMPIDPGAGQPESNPANVVEAAASKSTLGAAGDGVGESAETGESDLSQQLGNTEQTGGTARSADLTEVQDGPADRKLDGGHLK